MRISTTLVAALLASLPLPIRAHDIYSHLWDFSGASCCDNHDCRPADYRLVMGEVQMFVYGQWITVPRDKIQYRALPGDTGETGGGHWCGARDASLIWYVTRCVFLPPRSASISPLIDTVP